LQWYTRNTKKKGEDVKKGKIEEPKVWNFEAFILNAILTKRREKRRKRDKKKDVFKYVHFPDTAVYLF